MNIAQRLDRIEKSVMERDMKSAKSIWSYPPYAHTLYILSSFNKDLLTDEGRRIADDYGISWRKAHIGLPKGPEFTEEKRKELITWFIERSSKNEIIRPFIKAFDSLGDDLKATQRG